MASSVAEIHKMSLVTRTAERFGVDPDKMLTTLKATAFRGEVGNEQMMALLIVAEKYRLNPWTGELFAFPSKNGIVPVVSVDGWARIMNEHPQFDGLEFVDAPGDEAVPAWIECVIYRRDRSKPIKIRERYSETKRDTIPWKSHPARMLRHKAMIQCARVAFGFAGIYDEDEGRKIIEAEGERIIDAAPTKLDAVKNALKERLEPEKPNGNGGALVAPPSYAMLRDALEKATAESLPAVRKQVDEHGGQFVSELRDLADARAVELGVRTTA
jgi:phage recombination protein Bet